MSRRFLLVLCLVLCFLLSEQLAGPSPYQNKGTVLSVTEQGDGFLRYITVERKEPSPPFRAAQAETLPLFQRFTLEKTSAFSGPSLDYYLHIPSDPSPGLPLVVYLHGSGEKGSRALKGGLSQMISKGEVLAPETFVLVPQLPEDIPYWDRVTDSLLRMIDIVVDTYALDSSRMALAGVSLGGIGVWDLAAAAPGRFSRILSLCGRVNKDVLPEAFLGCEVRSYTVRDDPKVRPASVIAFTKALAEAGVDASHTQLNTTHAALPSLVFRDEELLRWLWLCPPEL